MDVDASLMLTELHLAARELAEVDRRRDRLRRERNDLIVEAYRDGVPLETIARAAGISREGARQALLRVTEPRGT